MTLDFRPDQPRIPPKPLSDCLEQAIRTAIHAGTQLSEVNFDLWAQSYETTPCRVEETWARCLTRVPPNSIEGDCAK